MLLTVKDMVYLLRQSVNVSILTKDDEGNAVVAVDNNYLSMTDEDLILYIKLGVTRAFPSVTDLVDLPDGCEFALVLLAKIELYLALAVRRSEKIDMGADNNNYLKQSQKFDHYMKLVEDARGQYKDWLDNEGAEVLGLDVVTTYDVLLSSRHYTKRNYERQATPVVRVKIDEVTADSVSFHWGVSNVSHFGRYKVFFSTETILDPYAEGVSADKKVVAGAVCLKSTGDIRDCYHRVTGLKSDTDYHIAVFSIERNQVFGVAEVLFTTLEEQSDEEDVSTEVFPTV